MTSWCWYNNICCVSSFSCIQKGHALCGQNFHCFIFFPLTNYPKTHFEANLCDDVVSFYAASKQIPQWIEGMSLTWYLFFVSHHSWIEISEMNSYSFADIKWQIGCPCTFTGKNPHGWSITLGRESSPVITNFAATFAIRSIWTFSFAIELSWLCAKILSWWAGICSEVTPTFFKCSNPEMALNISGCFWLFLVFLYPLKWSCQGFLVVTTYMCFTFTNTMFLAQVCQYVHYCQEPR